MKYLVFCEDAHSRKQIEEILTSASQSYEVAELGEVLVPGRIDGFDGLVTEHETWQRCAALLRYFECLETANQKPMLVFSKLKKQNGLKLRRSKAYTGHHPLPVQTRDYASLFSQMA